MFSSVSQRVLSIDVVRRMVFAILALASFAAFAASAAPHADAAAWCKSGYVWREAFPGDFACVTPGDRTADANENALAGGRHLAGSSWCVSGFVWREARPSDLACVPVSSRSREVQNNLNAIYTVADARTTPYGGSNWTSYRYGGLGGGQPFVSASGLTPGGTVKAFAVGGWWTGPYSLGTFTADGSGRLNGVATYFIGCQRNYSPASIVLLDTRTGNVTTTGLNYANTNC
jgi:hypothetical protein